MRNPTPGLAKVAGLGVAALVAAGCSVPDPASVAGSADRQGPAAPPLAAFQGGRDQILETYGNLPLGFVENVGQTAGPVRFYAQGSRYAFYLTPEKVLLSFLKASDGPQALGRVGTRADELPRGVALALRFLGSNRDVALEGEDVAAGEVNYFLGDDPTRWRTELPRYTRVAYRRLWPGVDLSLRGEPGELKYEFRVRPGARIEDIRLAYGGARSLELDDAGGLLIGTARGVLRDSPPVAYQEIGGRRVPVESRYVLAGRGGAEREFGFAVGPGYDPHAELIIDPALDYSTLLGGDSNDFGAGIAVDGAGNAYVVGTTYSTNFPTTSGAFDRTLTSAPDVFISKLNSSGSALVYSTYLGGTPAAVPAGGSDPFEFGRGIAVDGAGNAYVTGQTTSGNFPTTAGAFDRTLNVGTFDATDAFVTKLNATGSGLIYSTFLGGTDLDDGLDIALDGAGNAYVAGQTASRNLPTTAGGFDTDANGGFDAFVTKLNATGSALVYSTYLGGADNELPGRVAVDGAGNAYVGGSTRSAGFPTTPGAFDPTHNGGAFDTLFDAFVTKFNATGSGLVYSTFLGGSNIEFGDGLAIDGAGNAYVVGGTLSPGFPTTPGAFDTVFSGESEGFVTKLNSAGSALAYSTFLRGAGASAVAVDAGGNAWLAGSTGSASAPTTPDGFDTTHNGGSDAWIGELNTTGSALVYATFLGGSNSEGGVDIALDSADSVYVTGRTFSADFRTTPGAFDTVFAGNPDIFWGDAFVTRVRSGQAPPPTQATLSVVTINPSTVVGGNPSTGTVALTSAAPAGGGVVSLSSSNPAVAGVPGSVTVAEGATSATFAITTTAVSSSTTVTISAAYNGVTRTATLTVSPAGSAPLPAPSLLSPARDARFSPGQSIRFDWSDVAGAANYTIQIDNAQNFSSPFIVNQNVATSQFTTSSLPTTRMWWRVRANDAAGRAGAWSATRRFEVRS